MTDEECEADEQRRQAARFRPVERAARWTHDGGHVLAMMTCPGREQALVRTFASIGAHPMGAVPWPVALHVDTHREGQARAFFTVLRNAVASYGFTRLTLLEDDIVVARNFLDYIATTKIPDDVAMVSWFHRLAPNPRHAKAVWMLGPAWEFSHQQAITMPAATVHALLDSPQLRDWTEPHGADMLLGQVMPEALVAYHFPNVVDHVGGDSSFTGNSGSRRSSTFVGEDFDALDLTR